MANHKTKVIVTDDEQAIANLLAAILKQAGFDPRAESDACTSAALR